MDRSQTIRRVLGGFMVPHKTYPSPLPPDLAEWYCYTSDGGHSVLVVLSADYVEGADLTDRLVPAPVRAVLRGYKTGNGYVVCDLPYSPELGLLTGSDDDEF